MQSASLLHLPSIVWLSSSTNERRCLHNHLPKDLCCCD